TILEIHRLIGESVLQLSYLSENRIAIVTKNDPNVLKVINLFTKKTDTKRHFGSHILYFKVIGDKLIVGLSSHIISTSLKNYSIEDVITDVAPGYKGLIAMSSNPVKYMAFPSSKDGHVKVVDLQTNTLVTTINAHYRKISALSMNDSETLIATASEIGTVIRVFDLPTGVKLKELRRGHSSSAFINSLVFSTHDEYLTCTSDKDTIHIFGLTKSGCPLPSSSSQETPAQQPAQQPSAMNPTASTSWSLGLISGMCESIYNSATYIPSVIGSAYISERDFAVAKIPSTKKCLHSKKFAFVTCFDKMWLLIAADFQG
ncbi:unnamed protein product, partial [Hymenolepis diminuta]